MHRRIANTSVGASAVRGQPKKTAKTIRDFLEKLDLSQFKEINHEESFRNILDKITNELINKMPEGKFGFARKCLNIFLLEISHDTILVNEYNLDNLIPFLEVPLDNPNEKELRKEAKEKKDWNWSSISDLKPEDNEKIQAFAKYYMKKSHNLERVYFDLINWRKKE